MNRVSLIKSGMWFPCTRLFDSLITKTWLSAGKSRKFADRNRDIIDYVSCVLCVKATAQETFVIWYRESFVIDIGKQPYQTYQSQQGFENKRITTVNPNSDLLLPEDTREQLKRIIQSQFSPRPEVFQVLWVAFQRIVRNTRQNNTFQLLSGVFR